MNQNLHPAIAAALRPYAPPASSVHEEWLTCPNCNGSGEGMFDGTRCYECKGSGVEKVLVEDAGPDDGQDEEDFEGAPV